MLQVCSKHFVQSDFFMAGMKKTLRKNALPVIFPCTMNKIAAAESTTDGLPSENVKSENVSGLVLHNALMI